MLELFSYNDTLLSQPPIRYNRFLYDKINWELPLIGIKGPRGSGKTTLMLQRIRKAYGLKSKNALYITVEHPYFYNHNLFDSAKNFYASGGRYLFIDEVHKYPNWSREIKVIHDGFPDMKVIFSASSALEIYKGEADLSRRVIVYSLPGLSFREYLIHTQKKTFDPLNISDIINKHREISHDLIGNLQVLPLFKQYLRSGYLPLNHKLKENEYLLKLTQVINAVIDSDLAYIDGYSAGAALKVKKLLGVLSESVPFKPNVAALSRKLEISRDLVYNYLGNLRDARLLNFIHQSGKGVSVLQKPDKLYFENTNLAYALKANPDIGNLRETFLLNQLTNIEEPVSLPKEGDFYLEQLDTTVEVGGMSKDRSQMKNVNQGIVASDEIESGFDWKVPLWMFGFLY